MSEIYSLGERILIYSIISLVAIISSLVYLYLRVDRHRTSWYIFLLCLIYSSIFVFLNIIAMFDLLFNNVEGFEKFSKVILIFYEIFDYIDKIFGFILFPIIISILEGGRSKYKKILDGLFGCLNELYQTITRSFGIIFIFGIVILILIIIYRDHFGLKNDPFDYLFIILDCYAIYDIYTCVGFFMIQIFVDCRRPKYEKLINRYYRYSVIKIVNQTDNYINKMKNLSEVLNKEIQNYEKESSDYIYIRDTLKEIEKNNKRYESEGNIIINDNNNKKEDFDNNTDNKFNNVNNCNKNSEGNLVALYYLQNNIPSEPSDVNNKLAHKEQQTQKVEIKENNKEKEKKKDPVKCKKKFKKYVRRIDKLKKLYKEIEKEKDDDINRVSNKKRTCFNFIFFLAFIIVICTDFLLPIALNFKEDFIHDDKYEKEKSLIELIIGILFAVGLSIVCSSYTVITIFATKRRRYITGDFLYDKEINDDISLMKTVQIICGFSFAILYCNLYFWKTLDKKGVFGKPYFYKHVIIPDYTITNGISVYMIVKVIIIIVSIIGTLLFSEKPAFKNDLAEYILSSDGCKYDKQEELNKIKDQKGNIFNILNSEIKK